MYRALSRLLPRGLVALALAAGGLVAAAPLATAAATTYYVDCSQSADGSGTQASPWNDLTTVDARTFGPGDQILFKRGTTCDGQLAPQGSGAAGAPIVADAYGTGAQPEIAGNGQVTDTVYLYNQQYWELRDLSISNTSSTVAQRTGIHIVVADYGTAEHYRLTDLTVHDVSGDNTKTSVGIQFEVEGTSVPTKFDDVVLDGNTVEHVDRTGISNTTTWGCEPGSASTCSPTGATGYVPWTNIVWQDNTVSDIGGDGMIMRDTLDGVEQNNVAHDINMRSATNNAGIWTIAGSGTVIQGNEVYNVQRPAGTADGEAFDSDIGSSGTVVQYNYSHDNQGGFMLFCAMCTGAGGDGGDETVRYNVSRNDGSRIIMGAGAQSSAFYNNTVYLPPGSTTDIIEESHPTYLALDDNIIDNQGSGGYQYTAANYTFAANDFYGNHPATEPADPYKLTADPRLVSPGGSATSGYRLQSGSPVRADGVVVPDNGGQDYYRNPTPAACAPDRGADQASAFTDSGCTPVVADGGFESGTLAPWTGGYAAVTGSPVHSGSHALAVDSAGATAEQVVTVQPNTTYTLTGWGEVGGSGDQVEIGVKNYGGPQLAGRVSASAWTYGSFGYTTAGSWLQRALSFTTGPGTTQATVFCYHDAGSGGAGCDDISVTPQGVQGLANGGLESGALAPWTGGHAAVTGSPVHSGSDALAVDGTGATAEQVVTVQPNTTYTLTGWGEVGASGNQVEIGVKNYGGTQLVAPIIATSWSQGTVSFTTGPGTTQATAFCYHDVGSGAATCDDLSLVAV